MGNGFSQERKIQSGAAADFDEQGWLRPLLKKFSNPSASIAPRLGVERAANPIVDRGTAAITRL